MLRLTSFRNIMANILLFDMEDLDNGHGFISLFQEKILHACYAKKCK